MDNWLQETDGITHIKNCFIEKPNFRAMYTSSAINAPTSLDDLHDFYEIAFFINADLQIFIEDKKYEIHDGDILFIGPNVMHHLFYSKTTHYTRYVVHFKKDFIIDLLKSLQLESLLHDFEGLLQRKASIPAKQRDDFERLFKSLINDNTSFSEQVCRLHLALILIRCYEELSNARQEKQPTKKYLCAMQIVRYIDAHYSEDITLAALEKEFSFSRYYICHAFKAVTGFSIIGYIRYRRVVEAQRLLRE